MPLAQWATQVLDQVQACAGLLAKQTGDDGYVTAVQAQHVKIIDPETTPSARVLDALKSQYSSFHEFGLNLSLQHTRRLSEAGLTAAERATGTKLRDDSLAAQKALESETGVSFEEYVTRFNEALKAPK